MALFKSLKSIFKKPKRKIIPKSRGKIEIKKEKEVKRSAIKPPLKKKHFGDVYKILKEPHVSEKATVLVDQNKYIFKIYPDANKIEIKKAIESLYGARVKNINIINVHRKKRVIRGREGFKTGYKKAIVTLEHGEKIEILPH